MAAAVEEVMKALGARDLALAVAARARRAAAAAAVVVWVIGIRRVGCSAPVTGAVVQPARLHVEAVSVVAAGLEMDLQVVVVARWDQLAQLR